MKIAVFLLSTAAFACQAWAEEATPNLPPADAVARVLREAPTIRAAAAQLRAEEANRSRLEAGPHEWALRVGGQQRRTLPANAAEQRFNEWNAALERAVRLPGKGALDAEIGAAGVAVAETGLGDARHELTLNLLADWFAWLRENATAAQWQMQLDLLGQQEKGIQRRLQLGDAARIEHVQSAAARAQAAAQLAQAQARERMAAEGLRRRFPGLPLSMDKPLADPSPLAGNDREWVEAVLAHSHELAMADGEAERARLLAERARSERLPDPTLGVQFSRERAGEEKVLGAYLSIPLSGAARRAGAEVGLAQSEAQSEQAAAVRRRIASEAASLFHAAQAAVPAWQSAESAAAHLEESAQLTARAYQLGEGSLSEVLNARRLANEARLNATQARLEALERRYRLLLDTHRLWDFDEQ